jgi:hypothetical protein
VINSSKLFKILASRKKSPPPDIILVLWKDILNDLDG